MAQHPARQNQSEHRVDHAQENGVARHRLEILPPLQQRLLEIGKTDGPDDRSGRILCRRDLCGDIALIGTGHGHKLPCRGGRNSRHIAARAAADGTIVTLTRRETRSGPCRELQSEHTPNRRCRPSRLSEKYCRNANAHTSFRRHFASAKLQIKILLRIGADSRCALRFIGQFASAAAGHSPATNDLGVH